MFRYLQALMRGLGDFGLVRCLSLAAKASARPKYRVVGYATAPDERRFRVYIKADAAVTARTKVFVQIAPFRFSYCNGQPLGLRRAGDELSQLAHAHLLGQPTTVNRRDAIFQPA
jgi:hypothetical protein